MKREDAVRIRHMIEAAELPGLLVVLRGAGGGS
jgi:hypothetical protein